MGAVFFLALVALIFSLLNDFDFSFQSNNSGGNNVNISISDETYLADNGLASPESLEAFKNSVVVIETKQTSDGKCTCRLCCHSKLRRLSWHRILQGEGICTIRH